MCQKFFLYIAANKNRLRFDRSKVNKDERAA